MRHRLRPTSACLFLFKNRAPRLENSFSMTKSLMGLAFAVLCLHTGYAAGQLCTQGVPVPCPSTTQVITRQQAVALFDDLATNKAYGDLIPAYKYPDDGCFARAHYMFRVICSKYGYASWKVWNYQNPGPLRACSQYGYPNKPDTCNADELTRYVQWWYNVAPMVLVNNAGTITQTVIDPSTEIGPVSVAKWQADQNKNGMNGGNGSLEITIPEIFFHNQGAGDNKDPMQNECDLTPPFSKTNKQLAKSKEQAQIRAKALKLPPPIRFGPPSTVVVGIVEMFQNNMLEILGTDNNIYNLNMDPGNPNYAIWADYLTEEIGLQDYVYFAYDASMYVQDVETTLQNVVAIPVTGDCGGGAQAQFLVRQPEQFTLSSSSDPNCSQDLPLLEDSYAGKTPVLVSTDENQVILDVQMVPMARKK